MHHYEEEPVHTSEVLKPLQEIEASMKDRYRDLLGVEADYSPESLRELDRAIYTRFSIETRTAPRAYTILLLGYYLGETLIRNIPNGYWVDETVHHPFLITIKFIHSKNYSSEISPFRRIINYFLDQENSLYALYLGLNKVAKEGLSIEGNEKVIALEENGYHMRTRGMYEIKE